MGINGTLPISKNDKMKIPLEELAWIEPGPRSRLFMDLVEQCKIRFPGLKLIYAAMNYDTSLLCDFLLVFEFINDNKRGVYFTAPFIYTTLAIPGYRFAKREGKLDQWFNELFDSFTKANYRIFFEYLQSRGFGIFKGDENSWKDPDNFKKLAETLIEQQLLYRSKGSKHV